MRGLRSVAVEMEFATFGLSMDAILKRFSNPICEQKRSSICFKGEVYIYISSDTPSKSTDIIYSIMRSEIKCKGSYAKAILNSGKECPQKSQKDERSSPFIF